MAPKAGRPPAVRRSHDQPSSDPSDASDTTEETVNRNEVFFEVTEAPKCGYDARALGHAVFTQGEDWDDLKGMLQGAVRCHLVGDDVPGAIRLHDVRHEAITAEEPARYLRARSLQSAHTPPPLHLGANERKQQELYGGHRDRQTQCDCARPPRAPRRNFELQRERGGGGRWPIQAGREGNAIRVPA